MQLFNKKARHSNGGVPLMDIISNEGKNYEKDKDSTDRYQPQQSRQPDMEIYHEAKRYI